MKERKEKTENRREKRGGYTHIRTLYFVQIIKCTKFVSMKNKKLLCQEIKLSKRQFDRTKENIIKQTK